MLSKQRLSMTVHPIGIKLLTTPDSAGQQWMGVPNIMKEISISARSGAESGMEVVIYVEHPVNEDIVRGECI